MIDIRGVKEEGIGNGVARDIYSSFWIDATDSYFIGEKERVPFVRHDLFKNEWKAISHILMKGYYDVGYFPVMISKASLVYSIYGEVDEEIVDSFLNYICEDERETVQNVLAIDAKETIFESEDFLDIFHRFKCRSKVTKFSARNIITELAKQELIQKPRLMTHSWANNFKYFKQEDFQSMLNITKFYEKIFATTKRITGLIEAKPSNESEKDSLGYLKQYTRGLDQLLLKKFLNFVSESDLVTFTKINVSFTVHVNEFQRRPIVHTCGPLIEVPSTYKNFCELRFSNILSHSRFGMDFI